MHCDRKLIEQKNKSSSLKQINALHYQKVTMHKLRKNKIKLLQSTINKIKYKIYRR